MDSAIQTSRTGLRVGAARLAQSERGGAAPLARGGGVLAAAVAGALPLRLVGVDVPEASFPLPGERRARSLGSAEWAAFLADPFDGAPLELLETLGHALRKHLVNGRFGADCAANQLRHAEAAQRGLDALMRQDLGELGQDAEDFRLFLAFAHAGMDRAGRLLCWANRQQASGLRPRSYNERLLEAGLAGPCFVWPEVNPFRRQPLLAAAVPIAGDLSEVLADPSLRVARDDVHAARVARIGIFDAEEPLRLEPFELRYLARREPPRRWVVNLADPRTGWLRRPTSYPEIPAAEDRLYVPEAFVPLWVDHGWRREE